ncbi:hypothetical protein CA13_34330 [Planctomycetes bacterium CA13]|uniref:Uncharacterized protein n=1 Tax=Novipirellula herctigrandis TaxID=2527986 RepID=A0A5C5Z3Q8_9BACT|nr:hypothetical protein CA13_34330 [Planctomycetes bacterium CA13]
MHSPTTIQTSQVTERDYKSKSQQPRPFAVALIAMQTAEPAGPRLS